MKDSEHQAFLLALKAARNTLGSTAPNPPVGAALLDASGSVLSVQAHQGAGTPHAEALALAECASRGTLEQATTLLVTLEPCTHQGRTAPCAPAILKAKTIRRVLIGARDPNPRASGGADALRSAGLDVQEVSGSLAADCADLIAPFAHWIRTGRPWVTIKTAHQSDGSMIPPAGQKTFTSETSLRYAHELRKRADAILTGSGTILADRPEFTVRRVPDHPGKSRWLAILDRRGRVGRDYTKLVEERGLRPRIFQNLAEALDFLGSQGCLEVLVEAGPGLSRSILDAGIWNRHVVITSGNPDRIVVRSPQADVQRDH